MAMSTLHLMCMLNIEQKVCLKTTCNNIDQFSNKSVELSKTFNFSMAEMSQDHVFKFSMLPLELQTGSTQFN